jgi:hypothetical protein
MTLKKIGGKSFIVNLLADFILSKISHEENTIIKIVDCGNFLVIKGKTSSKEVLFLPSIISEFNEKFNQSSKLTHTIDLIEYDSDLEQVKSLEHLYHNNTPNCSYHYSEVENFDSSVEKDEMIYVSSFPHGYSLSQGRLLYYYGKKIFYNIPANYPITSMKFTLTTERNSENEIDILVYDEFFKSEDEILRSAILDTFDFNMDGLKNEIKKVDWSVELTNPLSDYDFLKEKVDGFIII